MKITTNINMTSRSQMNVNYDSDEEKTDDGDNPEFNIELFTFARAYTMQYVDMYYDFRVITAGLDNGTPGSIARVLPEILVMYNKECHDGKLLAKLKSLIRFLIDLTEDAPHNIYSSTKYLIRQLAKKLT